MKLFTIAAGILCLTSSVSGVVDKSAQKYTKIDFPPPLNWDPKESFYEKYGISSDNAPLEQYNSTAWVEYMMAQCSMFTACHSFATFAGKSASSLPSSPTHHCHTRRSNDLRCTG